MREVDFKELVGEHYLWGVNPDGRFGDANAFRFMLDDKVYLAVEDEEDGYRSSMDRLIEIDEPIATATMFPRGNRVVVSLKTRKAHSRCYLLIMTDVHTGKVVLEVGTDDTDDYYPSFVANFIPQNMAINKATPKELTLQRHRLK